MNDSVPVPGSARARLLSAGLAAFESSGFEAAGVIDIAASAGVTTGSLYHHFGSKLGLFQVLRREMERRVRDRLEGAVAVAGADRAGIAAALLVAFDAAVKFKALRLLSEEPEGVDEDTLANTVAALVGPQETQSAAESDPNEAATLAAILLGTWRSALSAAAQAVDEGGTPASARQALAWTLGATPE